MNTYMSAPGNTTKLGTAHSNIQTAQSRPTLVGSEPTMLGYLRTKSEAKWRERRDYAYTHEAN